jgi:hypothetical protein
MNKTDAEPPIVGPLPARNISPGAVPAGGDPYAALEALMVVVEALCPEWPPRPGAFAPSSRFIL